MDDPDPYGVDELIFADPELSGLAADYGFAQLPPPPPLPPPQQILTPSDSELVSEDEEEHQYNKNHDTTSNDDDIEEMTLKDKVEESIDEESMESLGEGFIEEESTEDEPSDEEQIEETDDGQQVAGNDDGQHFAQYAIQHQLTQNAIRQNAHSSSLLNLENSSHINFFPKFDDYTDGQWMFPQMDNLGQPVHLPPKPPATVHPFQQNLPNPFIRSTTIPIQSPPQNISRTHGDPEIRGPDNKVQIAIHDIVTRSGSDLKTFATHANSRDQILRRLKSIAMALGDRAIEADYDKTDVLITFRPMRPKRVPIFNELCAVWGGRLYSEHALVGGGFVQCGVEFSKDGLKNGSPTQGDVDAATLRAFAWVGRL